jgi:hypothetical protein
MTYVCVLVLYITDLDHVDVGEHDKRRWIKGCAGEKLVQGLTKRVKNKIKKFLLITI